jgi:hypothetical protein
MKITEEEVMAKQTPAGGWTRAQLEEWGVPWPPPKGWKKGLTGKTKKRIVPNGAIKRPCPKCSNEHSVFYFTTTVQTHLVMVCGTNWLYLPFEEGLPVETLLAKSISPARRRILSKGNKIRN